MTTPTNAPQPAALTSPAIAAGASQTSAGGRSFPTLNACCCDIEADLRELIAARLREKFESFDMRVLFPQGSQIPTHLEGDVVTPEPIKQPTSVVRGGYVEVSYPVLIREFTAQLEATETQPDGSVVGEYRVEAHDA